MDPLSISASLVAVIGAAAATAQSLDKLRSFLKDTSIEFCLLRNEISDLQVILHATESAVHDSCKGLEQWPRPNQLLIVAHSLQLAKDQLLELNRIVSCELIDSYDSAGAARVSKLQWFRAKSKLNLILGSLRQLKQHLTLILEAENLMGVASLQVHLQQISVSSRNFQAQALSKQDELLEKLSMQVATTETLVQSHSALQDRLRGLANAALADTVSPMQDGGTSSTSHPGRPNHPRTAGADSDVIEIRSSCYRRTCRPWCSCRCHKRGALGSSGLMKQFIGSLFIGYSGLPLITETCNEHQCRRRSAFRLVINYQFPKWFWTRALFASVVNDVMAGPEMLLRVPRQVPYTSETYQHCLNGDVASLTLLFDAGKASPFDVDPDGAFLLTGALRYEKYQMCQYLISKGADLYQEDQSGFSPYHFAWDMVLSEPHNSSRNNFVVSLFPQEEGGLDERQFNRIHKIVLELIGTPLEAELGISTASIDEPDNLGRTPLYWAAVRGDDRRVRLLLDHGADPQIRATKGNVRAKTPLHAAARSGDQECLSLLLQHGAQIEARDGEGLTPLFLVAGFNDGNKCLEILLEHGADINARAPEGHTPFMTAMTNGMLNNAQAMLRYNPEINGRDGEGWTALSSCVFWNMHESIRLLLLHGARLDTVTDEGDTLLHVAARYGDLETLRILLPAATRLQSGAPNTFGETALAVAKRRLNVTPEWHSAFQDLQSKVQISKQLSESTLSSSSWSHFVAAKAATTGIAEGISDDDDDGAESDEFEDAQETWT